jgi:Asp-tRNA(Asn)/Glu-tRNA(Gln) amidotransferase A subunit family amidase
VVARLEDELVMLDLPFRSATKLAGAIRAKKIGCLEILDLYLARVEKYDSALNAIIVHDFEHARRRARALHRARGSRHGVPMTIKESFDVAGQPTTWGNPKYKDHIAKRNALVVDRLLKAGVVLFGKTNVSQSSGLAELQCDLRYDEQSLGRDPGAGRVIGWIGGCTGCRAHRARSRQ